MCNIIHTYFYRKKIKKWKCKRPSRTWLPGWETVNHTALPLVRISRGIVWPGSYHMLYNNNKTLAAAALTPRPTHSEEYITQRADTHARDTRSEAHKFRCMDSETTMWRRRRRRRRKKEQRKKQIRLYDFQSDTC